MKANPIPHCPPDKLIFIVKDKADTTSSVKASGILLSFLHSSSVLEGHAVPTSVATCHSAVVVCAPVPLGSLRNSGRSLLSEGREK